MVYNILLAEIISKVKTNIIIIYIYQCHSCLPSQVIIIIITKKVTNHRYDNSLHFYRRSQSFKNYYKLTFFIKTGIQQSREVAKCAYKNTRI